MNGTNGVPQTSTGTSTGSTHRGQEAAAAGRRALRSPWTVVCVVAAVVLGPAAATASALEQANKAPLHHAVRAEQQAYLPADATRRRTTV
ncbi:hypothetical protein [Streptomyces sp. NPDC017202]|uniref:hypothetical protein n=1 Tax=Streptomyces sp. NPDC017202 TaxID=3364981 RepID=UPI00379DDA3E